MDNYAESGICAMLDDVARGLAEGRILKAGSRVLAAVSGGADSTALLLLLCENAEAGGYSVCAAHVHHGIRKESEEELAFVRDLCAQKNVPLKVLRADVPAYARETGMSIETAAREIRYRFLYEAAEELRCETIALAHHRRDQAETVLMHALRGSAIAGLAGMKERNGMLLRPLLTVAPEELREFLARRGQNFCEDLSNADLRYTRNFVRHVLLPDCEKVYPGAQAGLVRLSRAAAIDEDYLSAQAAEAEKRLCHVYPRGEYLDRQTFCELHPAIASRVALRVLRRAGADPDSETITRVLSLREDTDTDLIGSVHISAGRERVYIDYPHERLDEKRKALLAPFRVPILPDENGCFAAKLPAGELIIRPLTKEERESGFHGDGKCVQAVNGDSLRGAEMRYRREGDRIRPLGAKGGKNFADYMIDKHIDRQMRDLMPIVARGSDVLWLPRTGIAEECRVSSETENALLLIWRESE